MSSYSISLSWRRQPVHAWMPPIQLGKYTMPHGLSQIVHHWGSGVTPICRTDPTFSCQVDVSFIVLQGPPDYKSGGHAGVRRRAQTTLSNGVRCRW